MSINPPILKKSKIKLHNLQNQLPVKDAFDTIVRNKTCGALTRFVVVEGRIDSPPLLSRNTLLQLGMMKIDPEGTLAKTNDMRICDTQQVKTITQSREQQIEDILSKYDHVFNGIGKIYDSVNDRELYGKFNMKADAVPIAQKPRPVPYYLQEPLKRWLEEGIEEDIFERVPDGEPVTWCSPLVVQPKPRFTQVEKEDLEPHMIRASIDLRIPNKSMERTRIIQSPVVEDFIHKFHNCKVWSKLDMRQGYHQLMLETESRMIATFSTPWGNLRPKRLVFGAKASQDMFDEAMYRIFGDIPGCLNQRDDILIAGRTIEEHNETLEAVLQRAADFGITFNKDKGEFAKETIQFYGYFFTKDGLKPSPDKVRAIKDCQAPASKTAVRSFLGMTGYLSKFIPRYASKTAPLRELTHKDAQFKWGEEEQIAFDSLKDSITSDDTMTYFNPSRPIILRVEASYNEGLSAGLFQKTSKGDQPVHFISRTMTDTEKRYSQTEKDALSVKWAKDRFKIYLLGAPRFRIIRAHKPLIPLFNKATAKLPPRIEKWVMDMQDVDFEMIYEPGKDEADPLDFLSRHPMPETGNDSVERVIKHTIATEHAVVLDRIQEETQKDSVLQKLCQRILKGDWDQHKKDPSISPYYDVRQELYIAEGLVFRTRQIVLPASLQRKSIKTGHKMGHLGITKTKQMLREKYWFPTMNSMIDQIVGQGYECQVTMHKTTPPRANKDDKDPRQTMGEHSSGLWRTIPRWSLQPSSRRQKNKVSRGTGNTFNSMQTHQRETKDNVCKPWYTGTARFRQWSTI